MADGKGDKKRDWYGKDKDKKKSDKKDGDKKDADKKGDGKDGEGEKKPETVAERHAREYAEAHSRHADARKSVTDSHEAEMAEMAKRHAAEMAAGMGTEQGAPSAASAVQGAAAGTPPAMTGDSAAV